MVMQRRAVRAGRGRRGGWVQAQSPWVYALGRILVGLFLRLWVGCFRTRGADRIPATGGLFLIANHTSGMDPFLLGYPIKNRRVRGPGKVELFKNPLVGAIIRRIGIFPLHREGIDTAATRTMIELYRSGQIVAVYPEGGRSPTDEMLPFDPNFARLVIKLRATVVPAGIAGAARLLPIGTYIPRRRSPVSVVFGEPLDLSPYWGRPLDRITLEEAAARMREAVGSLVEEGKLLSGRP